VNRGAQRIHHGGHRDRLCPEGREDVFALQTYMGFEIERKGNMEIERWREDNEDPNKPQKFYFQERWLEKIGE